MLKKTLAVTAAGLGIAVTSAGSALATISVTPSTGFGGSTVVIDGYQNGVAAFDAPVADLRCAAPWYGSAVLGGSTPIGQMNVTCDDVKAQVSESETHTVDAILG